MTKYSLRARMLILTLAPTLLIGLLLTTFFVVHRYNQLQEQLVSTGTSIIGPLAIASKYGMAVHNKDSIEQLVKLLQHDNAQIVHSITILDANNNLFVSSNPQQYNNTSLDPGMRVPDGISSVRSGNMLILRTPILLYNDLHKQNKKLNHVQNYLGYIAITLDLRHVQLQQYKDIFVAILLLIICLCVAMLFAYRLMQDVTGPIRNMVMAVDSIRRGQLDSRIEGYMLGELDMLKNGINSMAISLADYHEEMQKNIDDATSELRETLEQMEIQNVELDLAKKRAQEAARIKSEFLANMSHEIRTPLNGVIGFTRQTLKTQLTPIQIDYLQTIERSANHLLNIINDVLDFSKLEAGKLLLENIPFALRETIDQVLVLLAQSAHMKGIELILDISQDVPEHIIGDPLRLQQIITNLLGNAIKFTEKGHIHIRIEARNHYHSEFSLEVQVHDTGSGIAEQQQSKLFQAFRQADASVSRSHGGTGLGLVITQKLVREMGGDINFHSQLNKGSTFWFHVPISLNMTLPPTTNEFNNQEKLAGKRLLFIESHPIAAASSLAFLDTLPIQVTHRTEWQDDIQQYFDIILYCLPTVPSQQLKEYVKSLLQMKKIAEKIILALPSHMLIDVDILKKVNISHWINKPLSQSRLLKTLLNIPNPSHNVLPSAFINRFPMTVMAIDDNPANLKLLGALLHDRVDQVFLCNCAEDAIEIAKVEQLDVILMDIQMPKIDGIRAAKLIHQLPNHQYTPIIAVTAHAAIGERERLIQAGMDDYLTKPIDENILIELLSKYLSSPTSKSHQSIVTSQTINWQQALQQSANKPVLAKELLSMLMEFLPEVVNRVENILTGDDDPHILELIHKLHGSCSYSGVPRLKEICHCIEKQLRAGIAVHLLEPEWLELLDEIGHVRRDSLSILQTL